MWTVYPVVLVSIHGVIDLFVFEVFVARAQVFCIAVIIPEGGTVEDRLL